MPIQEISRDEWGSFFNSFVLRHRRWLVTIELLGPHTDAQVKAEELLLENITALLNQTGKDVITILVGGSPHIIEAPVHVRVRLTDAGADEALEIESAGSTTVLRFRSAVLPEMVDGIL